MLLKMLCHYKFNNFNENNYEKKLIMKNRKWKKNYLNKIHKSEFTIFIPICFIS